MDDCCTENVQPETSHGCCAVKQSCVTENKETSCCDVVLEYNKLSEFFVQSEFDPQKINIANFVVELVNLTVDQSAETEMLEYHVSPILKKPKKKIYRLFHQAKTDPPLV